LNHKKIFFSDLSDLFIIITMRFSTATSITLVLFFALVSVVIAGPAISQNNDMVSYSIELLLLLRVLTVMIDRCIAKLSKKKCIVIT
jgi:hypothetical protein